MKRSCVCLAIALLYLAGVSAGSAVAAERGSMTVSAANPGVERSFPRITANDAAALLCAQINPDYCSGPGGVYCDTVTLNIEVPEGYSEVFEVALTLQWEGTANMVMYVGWASRGATGCPASRSTVAGERPRVVRLVEPEAGSYLITVVHRSGTNNGYTLRADWRLVDLGGGFQAPDRRLVPATRPSTTDLPATPTSRSDLFIEGREPADGGDERVVLVPGPDGQLEEVQMPVMARGDRRSPQQRMFDPVVASVVAFLLLSGAVLAVVAIRRRQAEL